MINATERDEEVPQQLRDIFAENNQLEFAVYNYVLKRFTQSVTETPSLHVS